MKQKLAIIMAILYYVAAKFRSAMPCLMTIKFYPFLLFPIHPLWNRPGRPKCWSLGKDITSGIHKDRIARQFKGTKETNGTTTHLRRMSGGGGLLSMVHTVTVNIGHVRNSKAHKVHRLETWVL